MPDTATHPLATRSGIDAILLTVQAQQIWRGATPKQRALIADLCQPVVAAAIAAGALTDDLLPRVPDTTPVATFRSLHRKGLIDDECDRLTVRAVRSYYWAAWTPPPAVIDVHLPPLPHNVTETSGDIG